MKMHAAFALALAGAAVAAPAGSSCPLLPASFEVSNFHFNGQFGPVILESYSFDVKGNVGTSSAHCQTASSGASDKCPVAFRDIPSTQCGSSDFAFSVAGNDTAGLTLQINYTLPNCPTVTGCRFFPASKIRCVRDQGHPNIRYENLTAPTSFSLQASTTGKCPSY